MLSFGQSTASEATHVSRLPLIGIAIRKNTHLSPCSLAPPSFSFIQIIPFAIRRSQYKLQFWIHSFITEQLSSIYSTSAENFVLIFHFSYQIAIHLIKCLIDSLICGNSNSFSNSYGIDHIISRYLDQC